MLEQSERQADHPCGLASQHLAQADVVSDEGGHDSEASAGFADTFDGQYDDDEYTLRS